MIQPSSCLSDLYFVSTFVLFPTVLTLSFAFLLFCFHQFRRDDCWRYGLLDNSNNYTISSWMEITLYKDLDGWGGQKAGSDTPSVSTWEDDIIFLPMKTLEVVLKLCSNMDGDVYESVFSSKLCFPTMIQIK